MLCTPARLSGVRAPPPPAGRGARRAPYDSIFNSEGVTLRKLAAAMPSDHMEEMLEEAHVGLGSLQAVAAK